MFLMHQHTEAETIGAFAQNGILANMKWRMAQDALDAIRKMAEAEVAAGTLLMDARHLIQFINEKSAAIGEVERLAYGVEPATSAAEAESV